MLTASLVLKKPIKELTPADLAHHGQAVRYLIGICDGLTAKTKAVLKELVDFCAWGTWETCTEDDLCRSHSPSAALLALLTDFSDRSIRRAYTEAEDRGFLRRDPRGWSTNRFVLDVAKILDAAQRSDAARVQERWRLIREWKGGFLARLRSDQAAGEDTAEDAAEVSGAPQAAWQEAPAGSAVDLSAVFAALPAELAAELVAAHARAEALLGGKLPHWHDLKKTPKAHRLDLALLCVAVEVLQGVDADPAQIVRAAGGLAGRLGAIHAALGYSPPAYMLRDIGAMRAVHGPLWWRKARPRGWRGEAQMALGVVRAPQEREAEYRQELEALVQPDALTERAGVTDGLPPGPPLAFDGPELPGDEERPSPPAELAAALEDATARIALARARLAELPELPDVSDLRPWAQERKAARAEERARQALSAEVAAFGRAMDAGHWQAAQEAAVRAGDRAAGLAQGPPS